MKKFNKINVPDKWKVHRTDIVEKRSRSAEFRKRFIKKITKKITNSKKQAER
jgi:hypothetical protein